MGCMGYMGVPTVPNMSTTNTRTRGANVAPSDDGTPDVYLSAREVGLVLGCSRVQAWRLMTTGVIPGVVDLSANGERATPRISRSALQAWVDTRAL